MATNLILFHKIYSVLLLRALFIFNVQSKHLTISILIADKFLHRTLQMGKSPMPNFIGLLVIIVNLLSVNQLRAILMSLQFWFFFAPGSKLYRR